MKQLLSFLRPLAPLLLLGCGPDLVMATGEGSASDTTETAPMTTSETTLASSEEGPVADSSGGTPSMSGSFLDEPDVGSGQLKCDIYIQDCPAGFKCTPWASSGSSFWNDWKCFPIVDNPGEVGAPCTVQGSGTSGVDDCKLGTMCWDVDPRTNEGVCIALCSGSERFPACDAPNTTCSIVSEGAIALCFPRCRPIEQDCPEGQACYPVNDDWQCVPDASGEQGAYGEPCEFLNACDPGLACLGAAAVPDCVGAWSCCSEICDLESREGDAQCTGAPQGQTCQGWFEEGGTPPGYENVGVCALP